MKKKNLFLGVALLSVMGLSAQSFGVKAGYNYANLVGDTPKMLNFEANHGFYVGASFDLPIADVFSIQPEVIYSRQGAKMSGNILGVKFEGKLNMDYVNVPVMAKLNIGDNFSVLAGPQVGFLVNDPQVVTSSSLTKDQSSTLLNKDNFAKFDFGLSLGAMYRMNGLYFDARYYHGLANTFDSKNNSAQNIQVGKDQNFRNSVFSVGVGFIF